MSMICLYHVTSLRQWTVSVTKIVAQIVAWGANFQISECYEWLIFATLFWIEVLLEPRKDEYPIA